jgi:hypothetical protein
MILLKRNFFLLEPLDPRTLEPFSLQAQEIGT